MVGNQVHYSRAGALRRGEPAAFVDRGARIEVGQWYEWSVTLAALQVASQKWGAITVTGPRLQADVRGPGGSARHQAGQS